MSLFDKLFSEKPKATNVFADEPKIAFGRYSELYKSGLQLSHLEKSISQYKGKKYLDAYEHFFLYLKDETVENVSFKRKNNRIEFEFVQGSKTVKGSVNDQEIYAEAEVVRFEELSSPVMAKLLQENNKLYFNKFVIKNNIYSLKYYSPVVDASPKSLYAALKELSVKADLFDDELINEFYTVRTVNTEHIKNIPDKEKQIKLKYFRIWLKTALENVKLLDTDLETKHISYILSSLIYSIHYLVSPEGVLLDDILNIESMFSKNESISGKEKNEKIIKKLNKIGNKTDEVILASLYKADATFAVNQTVNTELIKQFIDNEQHMANAAIKQGKAEQALEIYKYILSYNSFSFGMPAVINDFLQIPWRVFYPEYFKELGFKNEYYSNTTNSFDTDLIKEKINVLLTGTKKQYPGLKFNTGNLRFNDKKDFMKSFFNEFKNLRYS